MALYPGALPSAGSASPSSTLAAAGHTSLHNTHSDETRALASKIGTGASTPTSGMLLRGNGTGTSAWGQAILTTDVSGVLPQANGGTGTTIATGTGSAVYQTSPTITTPTLTTPTIASFINANHDHTNTTGGGQLGTNAIQDSAITSSKTSFDIQEATLAANFGATASATYQDTGLNVTLPAAGTWLFMVDLRTVMAAGAADFCIYRLFNVTTSTAITNTERIGNQNNVAATLQSCTSLVHKVTTTTTNNNIRVEVQPGGAYAISVASDINGRTHILAIRIGT